MDLTILTYSRNHTSHTTLTQFQVETSCWKVIVILSPTMFDVVSLLYLGMNFFACVLNVRGSLSLDQYSMLLLWVRKLFLQDYWVLIKRQCSCRGSCNSNKKLSMSHPSMVPNVESPCRACISLHHYHKVQTSIVMICSSPWWHWSLPPLFNIELYELFGHSLKS